jgi:serine/threonine protein kinase
VYQARALRSAFGGDVKPGDVVAIKIVPVEKEQDELLNEISILEQCKSVYITRYFGSYMKDEDCWIVMEFCGAGSVNDIMVSAGITLTEDIISVRRLFLSSFRFRRRPSVALSWELVE